MSMLHEEFYTVDVDIREKAQVNVSLRDCLNGIKSIKDTKDRINVASKLISVLTLSSTELTDDQKVIAKKFLLNSLKFFEDVEV